MYIDRCGGYGEREREVGGGRGPLKSGKGRGKRTTSCVVHHRKSKENRKEKGKK